MLDLRDLEFDCVRIAVWSEAVNDWTSGIAERQEFGDFVESFAGGVVASVADLGVGPKILVDLGEVEMRVTSGNDEGEHGKLQIGIFSLALLEQHGVDVAFEMVDRDERLAEREGQRFSEADANEQRSCEPWTLRDRDSID